MIKTHPLFWPVGAAAFALAAVGAYLAAAPAKAAASIVPIQISIPKESSAARLNADVARKALNEINSQLAARTAEQPKLEAEAKEWRMKQEKAEQARLTVLDRPDLKAKQSEVRRLQGAPPEWQRIGIAKTQPLTAAWTDPGNSAKVSAALALLRDEAARLQAAAASHRRLASESAGSRLALVVTVIREVGNVENSLAGELDLIAALDKDKDSLFARLDDFMRNSMRAKPGFPFINSVGIEMIWVSLGEPANVGYWIGKQEVTRAQFEKLLPDIADNLSVDGNGLVYRVLWREADEFCQKLTISEREGKPEQSGQVAPAGFAYQLPDASRWKYAKDKRTELGLLNFDSGVTELLSDNTRPGQRVAWGRSPGAGLFQKGFPEQNPFLIPDARDFSRSGAATAVTTGGNTTSFEGLVGFRVMLLQTP